MKTTILFTLSIILVSCSSSEKYVGYTESPATCFRIGPDEVKCDTNQKKDLIDLHKQTSHDRVLIDEP